MPSWHLGAWFDEGAFNLLFSHIKRQRPSLFNAATRNIAANSALLCEPVPTPVNGAPPLTIIPELVLLSDVRGRLLFDYSYQIKTVAIDFYPAGSSSNDANQFRLTVEGCVGVGLPSSIADKYLRLPNLSLPPVDVILPSTSMTCFCFTIVGIGGAKWIRVDSRSYMSLQLLKLNLVSIEPQGLHALLGGYIISMLNASVLAGAALQIEKLNFEVNETTVRFDLAPSAITPNPDISGNILSLFVDLT